MSLHITTNPIVLLIANHSICDCSTEHCPITSQNTLFFFPTSLYARTYLGPFLGTCTSLDQFLWLYCPHKMRWQNIITQLRGFVPCCDKAGDTEQVKNSFCTDLSPLPCLYSLDQYTTRHFNRAERNKASSCFLLCQCEKRHKPFALLLNIWAQDH